MLRKIFCFGFFIFTGDCLLLSAVGYYVLPSAAELYREQFFKVCENSAHNQQTVINSKPYDIKTFLDKKKATLPAKAFVALVNVTDEYKNTALNILVGKALDANNIDRVFALKALEALVAFSPNPHIGLSLAGLSSLGIVFFRYYRHKEAILPECLKVLDLLHSIGQDFNERDMSGETFLDSTIRCLVPNNGFNMDSILVLTEELLKRGADPTLPSLSTMNVYGWSPMDSVYFRLSYDRLSRYHRIYELFLKYGFQISWSAVAAPCTIL
jgi:hypothetical protein